MIKKHFPEEQQLSIVGENGQIEAFTFSGTDLTGGEVVDVVPGSSMPTLKAVQDEKIMAMWGAGMFNDPATGMPDTRKVVRMLGESIAVEYFDDTEQDRNKALMEDRTFQKLFDDEETVALLTQYQKQMAAYQNTVQQAAAQGIDFTQAVPPPQSPVPLPPVRDFYDHEVHIQVHNRFRKTQEYDDLPPELQAIIDQHVAEHEQTLMAPQIAQQQQQQAAEQAQVEKQSQEADKDRQFQAATKMQDHYNTMEREGIKGQMAMQTAQMKTGA